ncbi:Uncharacterised protein [Actinobacillus pleuropneumoniae]|nr:Uncharacterised protein [Actinobacillus pleuropneumoniae]
MAASFITFNWCVIDDFSSKIESGMRKQPARPAALGADCFRRLSRHVSHFILQPFFKPPLLGRSKQQLVPCCIRME